MRFIVFIPILIVICSTSAFGSGAIQNQQQMKQQRAVQDSRPEYPRRPDFNQPRVSSTFNEPKHETIDIVQVWRELEYSSEIWPLILDREPKEITVKEYIKLYQDRGIKMQKPPSYYVDFIDDMLKGRPDLLMKPFKEVLRYAAIIEYDYGNGQDKDIMARQLLGDKVYEQNKQRLGY